MIYIFDGTFDGLLTAVFDAFSRKEHDVELLRGFDERPLFCDGLHEVKTDVAHAARVWNKLALSISRNALGAVVKSFLYGDVTPAFYSSLYRFVCQAVTSNRKIEGDFGNPDVLEVLNSSRKVSYEASRMRQFVRFQKAADGTYFAMMEPLYDVLPMAIDHFADRFANSRFLIYDRRRNYGLFYDGNEIHRMSLSSDAPCMATGTLDESIADPEEALFKKLWRTYFNATAIPERMNPRKQRQDMPRRFWKYLTEMNGVSR